MIQLTELSVDIYYIINELLYSYDNNLRFVNKSINKNDEFITCHNKIIKNRLLKLKRKYSCIKIQLFLKKCIYYPFFNFNRIYIPPYGYNYNVPITIHFTPIFSFGHSSMIMEPRFSYERIIVNNDNIINKSTKYTKKKKRKKKLNKYNKRINNKRINYKRINYKKIKNKRINYKICK